MSNQKLAATRRLIGYGFLRRSTDMRYGPGVRPRAGRQPRTVRRPEVIGGEIVAENTPEQVAMEPRSYAGHYLAPMLSKAR